MNKKIINIYNKILNFLEVPYIKLSLIISIIAIIGILVFYLGSFIGKALYYLGF